YKHTYNKTTITVIIKILIIQHIIQVVEKVTARTKSDNVQMNISIPTGWKTELENLARIYSAEEGESIIFLDLLRIENI
ncbi:hypothetical protein, partial [Catenibacterium mitsuokai]|uniref:hypothetical protein n=1 Tax=Catenibacterium mitsuokai TaxID=100886 RepID=UPI0022E90A99